MSNSDKWVLAKKGKVNTSAKERVSNLEHKQSEIYERFSRLTLMYDPTQNSDMGMRRQHPSFNLVSHCVDGVIAELTDQVIRTRILPDNAEWALQRQAKQLQTYTDVLNKRFDTSKQARRCVFSAALKGLGAVKVAPDLFSQIKVESVDPDDLFVDNERVKSCNTRELHQRIPMDPEELQAAYPKFAEQIKNATGKGGTTYGYQGKSYDTSSDEVIAIESWQLPSGVKSHKNYKPGRHCLTIDGADLIDEEYHEDHFPFAFFRWSEGDSRSFYGIGGAFRIVPHQIKLNRLDYFLGHQIENNAAPVTYVSQADYKQLTNTVYRTGQYVPITGNPPQTVISPSVSVEQLNYRAQVFQEALKEFGLSRMLSGGQIPGGLESGIAVREAKEVASGWFAVQEAEFENLCVDISFLILETCKKLGTDAPEVRHTTFKGATKTLSWKDVSMEVVRSQMSASSNLAKTAHGRIQFAIDLTQAGLLSQEEARKLMDSQDVSRSLSIYTAALESIERQIEEILDGALIMPNTFSPLKMGIWRFTQAISAAENDGAPEEAIERLRVWVSNASWILDSQEKKQMMEMQAQQASLAPPPQAEQLQLQGPSPTDEIDPNLLPA